MGKCKNCQKEFEGKTSRAAFCSDKCRVYWNRKQHPTKEITPNEVVNEPPMLGDFTKQSERKWQLKERPQPPEGLAGLALRIWKDNHKL